MARIVILFTTSLLLLMAPSAEAQVKMTRKTPSGTLMYMIEAARQNKPELLKGLCPPDHTNDGEVDCICGLYPKYLPTHCEQESEKPLTWEVFTEYFRNAVILGEDVDGNKAEVRFRFGPDGNLGEVMRMVCIKKKWYLVSF